MEKLRTDDGEQLSVSWLTSNGFDQLWAKIDLSRKERRLAWRQCVKCATDQLAEDDREADYQAVPLPTEEYSDQSQPDLIQNMPLRVDAATGLTIYPSLEVARQVLGNPNIVLRDGGIYHFPGSCRSGDKPVGLLVA